MKITKFTIAVGALLGGIFVMVYSLKVSYTPQKVSYTPQKERELTHSVEGSITMSHNEHHIHLEKNNHVELAVVDLAVHLAAQDKEQIKATNKALEEQCQGLWEEGEKYLKNNSNELHREEKQYHRVLSSKTKEGNSQEGTSCLALFIASGWASSLRKTIEDTYKKLFDREHIGFLEGISQDWISYAEIEAEICFGTPFRRFKKEGNNLFFQGKTSIEAFGFSDFEGTEREKVVWRKQIQVLLPKNKEERTYTEHRKKFILKLANPGQKQCFIIAIGYEKSSEVIQLLNDPNYIFKSLPKESSCKIPIVSIKQLKIDLSSSFREVLIANQAINKFIVTFSLNLNESGGKSSSSALITMKSAHQPSSAYLIDQDFFLLHGSYDDNQDTPFSKHLGVFIGDTTYLLPLSA